MIPRSPNSTTFRRALRSGKLRTKTISDTSLILPQRRARIMDQSQKIQSPNKFQLGLIIGRVKLRLPRRLNWIVSLRKKKKLHLPRVRFYIC